MLNPIDVPQELTACLRGLGALVADDEIGPCKARNSDYWFPADRVAAELKCMSEDYFKDQSYQDWLNMAYRNWVARGLAKPIYAKSQVVDLAQLPPVCYQEVTNYVKERVERSLKSASKQIKATREHYSCPEALGLLILVNDGNYGVVPAMIQNIVARTLHKYTGINSVIHFTANMPSSSPETEKEVLFWCTWSKASVRPTVPETLLERIRLAWFEHHDRLIGGPVEIIPAKEDSLTSLKFKKG